jgi:hypothetical protein
MDTWHKTVNCCLQKWFFQKILDLICPLIQAMKPRGIKAIVAENILLRKQLHVLMRQKSRCPSLLTKDRIIMGFVYSPDETGKNKNGLYCYSKLDNYRIHFAHKGRTPIETEGHRRLASIGLKKYRWKPVCRNLFQTPVAA